MVKLSRGVFVLYLLLMVIGLIFIIDSSVVDAYRDFGNRWSYIVRQSLWGVISLVSFLIISNLSLERLFSKSSLIFWLNIALLVLVLIPGLGVEILGARRWLNIGVSLIQPSEFIKTSLVLYLPYLNLTLKSSYRQFIFTGFLPVVLILMQPDLGTALVVFASVLGLYFLSNLPLKKIAVFLPVSLILLCLYVVISPYRLNRVKTFIHPSSDNQNTSYQSLQSRIAIGRGGLFGVGIGQSRQKYNFLPESSTDSIFSIIAEETGLLGSTFLLLVFVLLVIISFKISQQSKNLLYSQTASGIAIVISAQTLLNLGALTGLLPLTGVPLPLISYGGSSLLNFSLNLGILSAIAKKC